MQYCISVKLEGDQTLVMVICVYCSLSGTLYVMVFMITVLNDTLVLQDKYNVNFSRPPLTTTHNLRADKWNFLGLEIILYKACRPTFCKQCIKCKL